MKINQLKAGVLLSYLSVGIGALVSIIYTPIMLRLLGQSEYGLYTLAGSVVSYLSILNFGLSSSYIRFYSKYKVNNDREGIAKLNGMFITVFFFLSLVAFIAGMILVLNTGNMFSAKLSASEIKITQKLMLLLVVNVALSFPASVFTSYITANEQYFFQRILNFVKSVASPFLSLAVLVLGFRSVGMVTVTVAVNLTIDLLYIWFCFKKLEMRFIFKGFELKLFKELAVFSSFIFINIIVDQINWNVDKFLLGIYQGSIATAVYGLAAQLNNYYNQMSATISSVFIPRVHKLVNENKDREIAELFTKVGRTSVCFKMGRKKLWRQLLYRYAFNAAGDCAAHSEFGDRNTKGKKSPSFSFLHISCRCHTEYYFQYSVVQVFIRHRLCNRYRRRADYRERNNHEHLLS